MIRELNAWVYLFFILPLYFSKHLHREEGGKHQFSPPLINHVGMASAIQHFLTIDIRSNKQSGSLSPLPTLLMCVFGFVIPEFGLICKKKKNRWSPLRRPSGAAGVDGGWWFFRKWSDDETDHFAPGRMIKASYGRKDGSQRVFGWSGGQPEPNQVSRDGKRPPLSCSPTITAAHGSIGGGQTLGNSAEDGNLTVYYVQTFANQ